MSDDEAGPVRSRRRGSGWVRKHTYSDRCTISNASRTPLHRPSRRPGLSRTDTNRRIRATEPSHCSLPHRLVYALHFMYGPATARCRASPQIHSKEEACVCCLVVVRCASPIGDGPLDRHLVVHCERAHEVRRGRAPRRGGPRGRWREHLGHVWCTFERRWRERQMMHRLRRRQQRWWQQRRRRRRRGKRGLGLV